MMLSPFVKNNNPCYIANFIIPTAEQEHEYPLMSFCVSHASFLKAP